MTDVFVNGEDQAYQDVEYPAADWTIRTGIDDAGATDGKSLSLKARYMDGVIQNYYGGITNQGLNPSNQYITYGVIKTPENVEYYINGVKTYSWGKADRGDMPWPYVTPLRTNKASVSGSALSPEA